MADGAPPETDAAAKSVDGDDGEESAQHVRNLLYITEAEL